MPATELAADMELKRSETDNRNSEGVLRCALLSICPTVKLGRGKVDRVFK